MRIPTWNFADRLRKVRQEVDMTQRDFAARLQVTPAAYAQWEAGNARPRDVVAVAKRVEVLTQVPAAWLLDLGPVPMSAESIAADGGRSGPKVAASWAPWGSNPQPAGSEVAQVIGLLARRRHRKPSGSVSRLVSATNAVDRATVA